MGTLSKIGMATLRIGVLVIDPELAKSVDATRAPYNLGGLSQAAAVWLFENHGQVIKDQVATVVSERTRLADALQGKKGIQRVYPSSANLLLLEVDDAPSIYQSLLEAGVSVRIFKDHPRLSRHLRITIGTPEDNDLLLNAWPS